jgi:catechol 2,3-dioxygenase-like lactoylglutathione lyase family enzyme
MWTDIIPKLPMRDKDTTRAFYINQLGFSEIGDYQGYLMVHRDAVEIHFFEFKELDPNENYGQVYIRTDAIEDLYRSLLANNTKIHPNGALKSQAWGQKEFSLLDPDNNLLTYGQRI